MREMDFLPKWYPELRTRRRRLKIQVWASIALVCAMALWQTVCVRRVLAAQDEATTLSTRLEQSHSQLLKVDELMDLQRSLRPQDQVMESIGVPIEVTRIMKMIEECLSPQMGLMDLSIEGVDRINLARSIPVPRAGQTPLAASALVERKLGITIRGVAPSDTEIADFLHALGKLKYLDAVTMSYTRDRTEDGHLMREFEVTCSLDLNKAGGN